jgi:UDP-GlcNAc:undecaprenyl-phosphate GlcNAc-1-phosphate transferase
LYYYSMTKVIDIGALAAPALASAILIGMCLGFLPHNFSPASIFMGDTGSMLLGLVLAYAPISSINSVEPALLASRINRYPEILPLLLPAALLVIPYADLLLAVIRRIRAGQSPFTPDRKHLHHRMLDIGHSQRASVLIMYLWAAVFSGAVVWLSIQRTVQHGSTNHHGQPILVLVAITGAAIAALLLLAMPKLRQLGRSPGPDESVDSAPPARHAGLAGSAAGVAVVTAARAAVGVANGTSGLTSEDPMGLRPPAAAPLPAAGPAEPQLVAAAAVSRSVPLAAPVPSNSSSSWAEPTPPNGSTGWSASGVSSGSSTWAEPAPPNGSSGHPRTAELGADDARASEAGPSSEAAQAGQAGHRSIIGTPPPAVTGVEPLAMRGANHDYRDRDVQEP